jgi:heme-degrading monooxygenase HmoA
MPASHKTRKEQAMFAVLFTVQPKQERWDDYLKLAKYLKPKLDAIDGFIDNDRYESTRAKGRLLSLSTWRDEKAVVRWRTQGEHHAVQEKGRFEIFEDYHLSVGEITADTEPRDGLAIEEKRFDQTAVGDAKVVTIAEITPKPDTPAAGQPGRLPALLRLDPVVQGCIGVEVFKGIYNPGRFLVLGRWRDAEAARRWKPGRPADVEKVRHRQVRVIRDYGMFDRREAPQFYPEVRPRHG